MTLVLEFEYLSGVSFAAVGPDSDVPDWPPQPDRIFSALVASWAARGQRLREAEALEWLEKLPAPRVLASDAEPRTVPIVFVPPNDPRSDKQKNARGVLPTLRRPQPRRFPAARPHDPVVRLFWIDVEPDEGIVSALQQLARDTSYIGHSTSFTRCRFIVHPDAPNMEQARAPERRVYTGRFAELRQAFDAGRRPRLGARAAPIAESKQQRSSLFGERWMLFDHVAGTMPDVRACAVVAKTIRDALLSGYQRIGRGNVIPEIISGHAPDGSPLQAPHLAIVPLPFIGVPQGVCRRTSTRADGWYLPPNVPEAPAIVLIRSVRGRLGGHVQRPPVGGPLGQGRPCGVPGDQLDEPHGPQPAQRPRQAGAGDWCRHARPAHLHEDRGHGQGPIPRREGLKHAPPLHGHSCAD